MRELEIMLGAKSLVYVVRLGLTLPRGKVSKANNLRRRGLLSEEICHLLHGRERETVDHLF